MDYWDVLGLPRQLALDGQELAERYRELSRRLHPDLYATLPEAERAAALGRASELNDAYRTLRDPEARARYLLAREGASGRAGTPPTELLQELFDLNQELEEAADRSDREEVGRIAKAVEAQRRSIDAHLDTTFRAWDAATDSAVRHGLLRELQLELDRASYWRSLDRQVRAALEPGP